VVVAITKHARERFRERWQHAFPDQPLPADVDALLVQWFRKSHRIEPASRKYKMRLKRHGKDTLYFDAQPFVFVVQSASLRTVELATRDKRPLNKLRGPRPSGAGSASAVKSAEARPAGRKTVKQSPVPEPPAPAPPKALPRFILHACADDEQRKLRFVNLGTYPSAAPDDAPQRLAGDREFLGEVQRRFCEKRPTWTLVAVYAQLGKNGDQVKVFEGLPAG
jgi:hypothetical protein